MAKKQYRALSKFTLGEISAVTKPAQSEALSVLMKSAIPGYSDPKEYMMTTVSEGHQHIIHTRDYDDRPEGGGSTSWVPGMGENEPGHQHPWIIDKDGKLVIGMALGHTHEVAEFSKHLQTGEKDMKINKSLLATTAGLVGLIAKADTDEGKGWAAEDHAAIRKAAVDLNVPGLLPTEGPLALEKGDDKTADLDALKARLEKSEAIASLTSVQKGHFDGLDEAGKAAFLKMDGDARNEAIAKANESDPVIAEIDGVKIRKSADPVLVVMAKRLEKSERENAKALEDARDSRIEKAAADYQNLSGTEEVRKALVGAVLDIKDEELRKGALEMLKAAAAHKPGDYQPNGEQSREDIQKAAKDGEDKLDKMAKDLQKADPKLSYAKAYREASQTPEGREIRKAIRAAEQPAQ